MTDPRIEKALLFCKDVALSCQDHMRISLDEDILLLTFSSREDISEEEIKALAEKLGWNLSEFSIADYNVRIELIFNG